MSEPISGGSGEERRADDPTTVSRSGSARGPLKRRIRGSSIVHALGWIVALAALSYGAILLGTALWLSVGTPFRLIDDYGDWNAVFLFEPGNFVRWLFNEVLSGTPERWRPGFTLWNAVAWTLLGPSPACHHMSRLAATAVTAAMSAAFVSRAFHRSLSRLSRINRIFVLAIPVLLILFWPNRPDARLAPQEVPSALWLAVANLLLIRIVRTEGSAGLPIRIAEWVAFAAALLLLAVSKETNVAFLPVFLLAAAISARRVPIRTAVSIGIASLAVLVLSVRNILVALRGAGYAHAEMSLSIVAENAIDVFRDLFGFPASAPLALVLLAAVVAPFFLAFAAVRKAERREEAGWTALMCAETVALFAMLCLQWKVVLRYWYPLVPLVASLAAVSAAALFLRFRERPAAIRALLAFLAAAFLVCNGHDYCLQFVVQRTAGEVEGAALRIAARDASEGRRVLVRTPETSEYHEHFLEAAGPFRRRFGGTPVPLVVCHGRPTSLAADETYATMARGELPVQPFEVCSRTPEDLPVWPVLRIVRKGSALFQFRRQPVERLDAGAVDPRYVWLFFRGPVPESKDPSQ